MSLLYFKLYLKKSKDLDEVIRRNKGAESPEEDALLEQLDDLWWKMSDDERAQVEESAG